MRDDKSIRSMRWKMFEVFEFPFFLCLSFGKTILFGFAFVGIHRKSFSYSSSLFPGNSEIKFLATRINQFYSAFHHQSVACRLRHFTLVGLWKNQLYPQQFYGASSSPSSPNKKSLSILFRPHHVNDPYLCSHKKLSRWPYTNKCDLTIELGIFDKILFCVSSSKNWVRLNGAKLDEIEMKSNNFL